ncbi:SPRY domain-containing SOCS box protein 3 [Cephus cinctus]|uniref:SPRY domain-containing SOCS box protein 3 n=1 Tax=Cephus cinctus TaxID=211228 RepID=A0AAJ7C5G0_CEPCN|nr:SPRY domain-containing SOCS box protein 3 [Cephus cinctus]
MFLEYDPEPVTREQYCACIENECHCEKQNVYEWAWDDKLATADLQLTDRNLEVKFHPGYSTGTAAVRGTTSLAKGRHHYWEVKMITPVYGTDVMVGMGTHKVTLDSARLKFCSLLGLDCESWGFSYKGYLQHAGEIRNYAPGFSYGSLVGVHLDTWRGTLQFFHNRKPLGIAFTGLRDVELYPMISSTAAKSRVRITYSCSEPASLQMASLSVMPSLHKTYLAEAFPGLKYITQSIFADVLQKSNDNIDEDEQPHEFMILDDFDIALVGFPKGGRSVSRLQSEVNATINSNPL